MSVHCRNTVSTAILLLVISNLFASLSDVAVKLLDGEISPFQYTFLRLLISAIILFPLWWRSSFSERRIGDINITVIRAHLVLIGSGCMMVALTYMPLTTANAVFYTAPLLMMPLSYWLLNESVARTQIMWTLMGFIGVLIILRPSQFHWAAICALVCALTFALYNVLVKKLPSTQPVTTTLFWTCVMALPVSGGLAIAFWQPISWSLLGLVAASAIAILITHGLAILAYQNANTSRVGMAEYSGLLFVTWFGVIWFDEIPEALTFIGVALIIAPIMLSHWRGKS